MSTSFFFFKTNVVARSPIFLPPTRAHISKHKTDARDFGAHKERRRRIRSHTNISLIRELTSATLNDIVFFFLNTSVDDLCTSCYFNSEVLFSYIYYINNIRKKIAHNYKQMKSVEVNWSRPISWRVDVRVICRNTNK